MGWRGDAEFGVIVGTMILVFYVIGSMMISLQLNHSRNQKNHSSNFRLFFEKQPMIASYPLSNFFTFP